MILHIYYNTLNRLMHVCRINTMLIPEGIFFMI